MAQLRPALVIEPEEPADASVIWLHGLGADGYDFEPLVPELGPAQTVRFIFPHAPHRGITINNGYEMRAWYDLRSQDPNTAQDEKGIRTSERLLRGWIDAERERGIVPERIVLAGFSQGGAMVLHTGLRYEVPLAGILALSTYLPLAESVAAEMQPHAARVPIFMAHGRGDPIVPIEAAIRSRRRLKELGCAIEWQDYPMPHSLCPEEIDDIRRWLKKVLGITDAG